MTITIDLEPEIEQQLREIAEAEGKEVAAVVYETVTQRLKKARSAPERTPWRDLPKDKWLAEFDAWIKSHPQVGHLVDDSRDSIYPD